MGTGTYRARTCECASASVRVRVSTALTLRLVQLLAALDRALERVALDVALEPFQPDRGRRAAVELQAREEQLRCCAASRLVLVPGEVENHAEVLQDGVAVQVVVLVPAHRAHVLVHEVLRVLLVNQALAEDAGRQRAPLLAASRRLPGGDRCGPVVEQGQGPGNRPLPLVGAPLRTA